MPLASTYFNVSSERETCGTLDKTVDFSARKVLGNSSELLQIDVSVHDAVGTHFGGVNC